MAQEGLSNAVKHSGASTIKMIIEFGDKALSICIEDNGKGFDPSQTPGSLVRAGQMGLVGMFERAELLGASVEISSKPGSGTFLTVVIPFERQPSQNA